MSWLFEDPTPVLAGGALILVLLAVVLYQTGRAVVLGVMAGVVALVAGLVVLERAVVTDEEAIHDVFDQIAAALEISANTAASRYRYALVRLREQLAAEVIR